MAAGKRVLLALTRNIYGKNQQFDTELLMQASRVSDLSFILCDYLRKLTGFRSQGQQFVRAKLGHEPYIILSTTNYIRVNINCRANESQCSMNLRRDSPSIHTAIDVTAKGCTAKDSFAGIVNRRALQVPIPTGRKVHARALSPQMSNRRPVSSHSRNRLPET